MLCCKLNSVADLLTRPITDNSYNILVSHYPLLNGASKLYHECEPYHGCVNGDELLGVLHAAKHRPHMYLHGHVHKGYQDTLRFNDTTSVDASPQFMLSFNPGSSGYGLHQPASVNKAGKPRSAAFNVYTITYRDKARDTTSGSGSSSPSSSCTERASSHTIVQRAAENTFYVCMERYVFDGQQFVVEPVAYESGY